MHRLRRLKFVLQILPFSIDCSRFLNWSDEKLEFEHEKANVFRSLVATLKILPSLDDSLEDKVVKCIECVSPQQHYSADEFLSSLASFSDDYSTNFIQSIGVLISTPIQVITNTGMEMLRNLIKRCSHQNRLAFVKADLIPQIINTLNPQSLSFTEAIDIHTCLVTIISYSVWLSTQNGLASLKIEDWNGQQAVRETVLKQVIIPSEKYICHLCVNRFSIVDGDQSENFLEILTRLLEIAPYYQPTMDSVLNMPVLLTIPSCLTFSESDDSISWLLHKMNHNQREWNDKMGEVQKKAKTIHQMLRMEGIEDVMEEKLKHDKDEWRGRWIVVKSIEYSNQQGENIQ
ncbi:hypothetical protein BLNAU_1565 [Blattamonas nauphoetae]|uniref:Uncharacterized protein n=1 Tax=Blattamonas nauphoetae TaxID=2049346 RepID=A0ABQ9YIF9_9EUKA|nr:hypothetical protein BLNAU_1565 [Blattamonas nauphoetae]